MRALGVLFLLGSSVAAADSRCLPVDYYATAGVWGGLTTTPERSSVLGFELGTGLAIHQCREDRVEPLLEVRIGPVFRLLGHPDVGGVILGGDLEVSYPLEWHDTRLGAHIQLGIAAEATTQTLFYSAAGARLRYRKLWAGFDIVYTHGNHRDFDGASTFENRSGSGAIVGAGFEGPGATVLTVLGSVVGTLLLFVAATSE